MATALRALNEKKVVEALTAKCEARSAGVGIIGMGYVGLPLALSFARPGFATSGFDIDLEKGRRLGRGESYIKLLSSQSVADEVGRQRLVVAESPLVVDTPNATRNVRAGQGKVIRCLPTVIPSSKFQGHDGRRDL